MLSIKDFVRPESLDRMDQMNAAAETSAVVESYFAAWVDKRPDEAYKWLAKDLVFVGPTGRYTSAAEFRPALNRFSAMTRRAKIIEFIVDDDRAAMLYECELADPVGTIHIMSFFRVREGKICWYETQFDATNFRALQSR
jgi:SnoaL-like domain